MSINEHRKDLIFEYKSLINVNLPAKYQSPVSFNHCFNRVILDWLFNDCWYNYLNKNKTAVSQLSKEQLQASIIRMKSWLTNHDLLMIDNHDSLRYRKKVINEGFEDSIITSK